jgi:hypothetical protein
MEKRFSIKRASMLITAVAFLVLALASPALASGATSPATAGGPCASMEITTYKARWSVDEKQSVSNRPKSETGKQLIASTTSKQFDPPSK